MAVIHDVMPAFELFQPETTADAVTLLDRYSPNAWVMAGGMDSFDWLKDRIKRPSVVIDLSRAAELRGIKESNGGLEIGAADDAHRDRAASSRAREVHAPRRGRRARRLAADSQPGTVGGNVSQDTRCWYYRAGWSCYRAGGNICYADTPTAINREHAILDADRCVAVNPSDTAPALIALDAQMVIQSARGQRVVEAENFFIGPGTDITRMTVLGPDELLTAIRIPSTWAGAQFYFEKVRDRNVWDFPLLNVASATTYANGRIERIRMVVNAAAARPLRLHAGGGGRRWPAPQ
jgi:xanthine dehydrogenase YagS FAD-binding subunit